MNIFKNLLLNLKVSNNAAVLCVWLISISSVGIFGTTTYSGMALGVLLVAGLFIVMAIAMSSIDNKNQQ